MKYIIKNKIFSLGAGSTVKDEAGNDLYRVKGKVFTLTKKKYICTLDKQTLYIVNNKLFFLLLPKVYLSDAKGNRILMIKKKSLFSFKQNFEIIPMNGSDHNFSIEGDYIGRHYDLLDNGIPVAHIRRNFNVIKDSFWLETDYVDNAPLYIAFVIALDNFFDKLMDETR